MSYRVSREEFAALVEEALQELPEQFAEFLEEVPLEILDWPDEKHLRAKKTRAASWACITAAQPCTAVSKTVACCPAGFLSFRGLLNALPIVKRNSSGRCALLYCMRLGTTLG